MRSSIVVFLSKSLRLLCVAALTCAIVPTLAFANTDSVQVFEKDVPLDQVAVQHAAASSPETVIAETEQTPTFFLAQMLETTHTVPMMTAELPLNATNDKHVSADQGVSAVVGSFERDGVVYAFEPGGTSVAVVAVDPEKLPLSALETRDLALPSAVATDDEHTYPVSRIANYAFSSLASAAVMERGVSNGGAIVSIFIPSSVAEIGDNAFAGFDAFERIEVAEENPVYGVHDGCLYDAALSCLLLVPEGKQGAVLLPRNAEVVDASKFSHCSLVDAISVEEGSAAFSSVNDLLYDGSGATLLRIPAGATDIALSEKCERIEAGAAEGCTSLETIVAPNSQVEIAEGAFGPSDSENRMYDLGDIIVILPAEATTSTWKEYGFMAIGGNDLSALTASETQERLTSGIADMMMFEAISAVDGVKNEKYALWECTELQCMVPTTTVGAKTASLSLRCAPDGDVPYTLTVRERSGNFTLQSNTSKWKLGGVILQPPGFEWTGFDIGSMSGIGIGMEVTLTASFKTTDFRIDYDLDGGAFSDDEEVLYSFKRNSSDYSIPIPEKKGHVFKGWTCSYADPEITDGGSTTPTSTPVKSFTVKQDTYASLSLKANWEPIEYEVHYWSCDGRTPITSLNQTCKYGIKYAYGYEPGEQLGYTGGRDKKLGWSSDPFCWSEPEVRFGTGAYFSDLFDSYASDGSRRIKNFYLSAVPKQYTLTFDVNANGDARASLGGFEHLSLKVKYNGTDYHTYMTSVMPSRPGYVFAGWYDSAENGIQVYDGFGVGQEGKYWWKSESGKRWDYAVPNDMMTLYAHWIKCPEWYLQVTPNDAGYIEVTENATASDPGGTPGISDVTYGYRHISSAGLPTFNCLANEWGGYQWWLGTDGIDNSSIYEKGIVRANDGYVFKGWRLSEAEELLAWPRKTWSSGIVTQHAVFEGKKYTVDFDACGGLFPTGFGGSVVVTMGSTDYFNYGHACPTLDGYIFDGWYDSEEEGNKVWDSEGLCVEGPYWKAEKLEDESEKHTWDYPSDLTVYAHWIPNSFCLTLDANGGKVDEQNVWSPAEKVTMGESTNSTVPAAVRPGYTFQGWYTESEGGEQIYATTESGNCTVLNEGTYWKDDKWRYPGDATFYAHWKANSFTIIFDANGVDAEMPEELEVEYDSEGVLSSASAEGYVFNGWETEPDGSGKRYEEGDAFGTLTTEADAIITLYAQWVPALRISVPISVRLLVDASGVQEQEAGLGYIESRSISALKITNIEFAPLSEAADLFGSRVADVFLKVLSGAAASTDVIFALDANASEDDIDKLAPFALPAGIGARTNVEYRLDIPDAALADIDSDRFSEDPAQIGRVTYTAGLA